MLGTGYIILTVFSSISAFILFLILYDEVRKYFKSVRDLTGHHVLITGGSSGIGKEVGIQLAKQGANVSILARDLTKLQEACEEILCHVKRNNQKVNFYKVDVSNWNDVETVVEKCMNENGPVDILVNSAGYCYPSALEDIPLKHFQGMMDVNYMGNVHLVRAVCPTMKSRRKGIIVIVSSLAGLSGLFGYTGYSASKFALRGFAEALQMEVKPYKISVTVNFPPMTDTPCLVEEHKLRPIETKFMEESAGLFHPRDVARNLINDALRGNFFSTCGFDGHLLMTICAGMSQENSILRGVLQTLFMGVLRVISLGYLWSFSRIVKKCAEN